MILLKLRHAWLITLNNTFYRVNTNSFSNVKYTVVSAFLWTILEIKDSNYIWLAPRANFGLSLWQLSLAILILVLSIGFTVVGLQTGVYRSSADFADFPPNWMLCDSWKMDYTSMNIYGLYLYSWNVDIPEFLGRNNGFVNLILKYSVWGKEQWTVNPPNPPALRTGWGKHTH